jgi:hypothetical protein
MKLALFSPYGLNHVESGLLYLVANYLTKAGADVVQLRCDGALPACGRDHTTGGVRNVLSCSSCISEQRALAQWSSSKSREISSFIVADDVMQTSKWISSVNTTDLSRAEFRGLNLWSVCQEDFSQRHPNSSITALSGREEEDLRALYVSFVHGLVASERFITMMTPTISFVAGGNDPLSRAYIHQAQAAAGSIALFSYDPSEEAVVVQSTESNLKYMTKLILSGVTAMRNDPRAWAPEVSALVHEILTYLGYAPDRLA